MGAWRDRLVEVCKRAKELATTEDNLGNSNDNRGRYLAILNRYFNFLSTKELKKRSDKILKMSSAEPAEQSKPPYPLWKDRPKKRSTNPAAWILEYHGDLIGTKGARVAIGRRDSRLIQAYAVWISPRRHPEDDLGLDTQLRTDLSDMSVEDILERKKRIQREAMRRLRSKRRLRSNRVGDEYVL